MAVFRYFDSTIYTVGGLILWLIFTPLLSPMYIVSLVWKLYAFTLVKCFQPHLIPINFKDAFFALYSCDEQPLMSVGTTIRLQGRVETELLIRRFKECFLTEEQQQRYENLYCYFVVYDGYVFKRRADKLVVENHFIEKTLPNGMGPEEYLGKWLVSDTYQHKPEGQPSWQVAILRHQLGEDREETFVSIKMHHGLIDGYSLVHLVDRLTGIKSPYIVHPPKKESVFTKLKQVMQGPALAFEVFCRSLSTQDLADQGDPFHTEWFLSFVTLDVDLIKSIRKKTKAKFATIVMTAAVGALKRLYMEDKRQTFDSLPPKVWIESPLALPQHPAMTQGGTFCNHFTAGIYAVPFRTNDRLYRLQFLEEDFNAFREHSGLQLMTWVLYRLYWLHPVCILRKFTNYLSYLWRFSVLYSGMITYPHKVSLLGHPVDNIYFLQATASAFPYVSLFMMSSTYDGKLDLSCYASKGLVKNKEEMHKFYTHLKAELVQMNEEFSQRNVNVALNMSENLS